MRDLGVCDWLIARAALLVAVASAIFTCDARADSEGFVDNWRGDIRAEARLSYSAPPVPLPVAIGALSQQFGTAWGARAVRDRFCGDLNEAVADLGGTVEVLRCTVATSGELRGRFVPPNQLDLKYVVPGNGFRVRIRAPSLLPSGWSPEFTADIDIELRATITIDDMVNGNDLPADAERQPGLSPLDPPEAPYLSKPVRLSAINGTIVRAKVDSRHVVLNELPGLLGLNILDNIERKLSGTPPFQVRSDTLGVGDINRSMHSGAKQLVVAMAAQTPEVDSITPVFTLATRLEGAAFVIQYQRRGFPLQALPGCHCESSCEGKVSCTCAGAGIVREGDVIVLQRQLGGRWVNILRDESTFSFSGIPINVRYGEVVRGRICRPNEHGSSCSQPFTFEYKDGGACPSPAPLPYGGAHCGSVIEDNRPCIPENVPK